MRPEDVGARYDRLAAWWQASLSQSDYGLSHLSRAVRFVEKKSLALDVGCGSNGRFIESLLAHGFQCEGIDVSGEMVALISKQFPNTLFYHADVAQWTLPKQYDLITAWDSTFHLPLELQEPVMKKLCAGLRAGGALLFTCGGGDDPKEIIGSFENETFGYSTLGVKNYLKLLDDCGCLCRHIEYDQYPENHVVVVAQKQRHEKIE